MNKIRGIKSRVTALVIAMSSILMALPSASLTVNADEMELTSMLSAVQDSTCNFPVNFYDYDESTFNRKDQWSNNYYYQMLLNKATNDHWNAFGDYGATQGIVKPNLIGNQIQFIYTNAGFFDDKYKFNNSGTVDFPFLKTSDGYYKFDSSTDYAHYNKRSKTVDVSFGQSNSGFFPLNDLQNSNNNFFFSMSMAVNFTTTADGRVKTVDANGNTHEQDMIFDFSGDDDVWVFIDGTLVLDIGGIHRACHGKINFNTLTAKVDNVTHVLGSGGTSSFSSIPNIREAGASHTLRIFYMERGAGDSNCMIKFNLPQALDVSKTATYTGGEPYDSNKDRTYDLNLSASTTQKSGEATRIDTTANITDVIDPRFEITENGINTINNMNGHVSTDNGVQTITWENPPFTDGKWSQTIEIKAKDDFLGGNDIPTNGENSKVDFKVSINGGNPTITTMPFQKPTVNVPIRMIDANATIFYDELIPDTAISSDPEAMPIIINKMINGGKELNWWGKDPTGTVEYYWVDPENPDNHINSEAFANLKPSDDETKYELHATFTPSNSSLSNEGPVQGDEELIGIYSITVIKGSIDVTKIITGNINYANGDPIFVFKLERLNENGTVLETTFDHVRFSEVNLNDKVTFENLKKGEYRVSEIDTIRYKYKDCEVTSANDVDCEYNGELFNMFYTPANDGTAEIIKNHGAVTFTNEKFLDKYCSDTAVLKNSIKIDFNENPRY